MSIRVIDDCLSVSSFNAIAQTLTSNTFPWYYLNTKVGYGISEQDLHDQQFVHNFYNHFAPQSPHLALLDPIIDLLDPAALIRIKANLTTFTSEIIQFPMHVDIPIRSNNCMTAIYYVNTNNGYTIFETGERVDSVANRLVIFNTSLSHTGTTTTDTKNRCIINFNYYSESEC